MDGRAGCDICKFEGRSYPPIYTNRVCSTSGVWEQSRVQIAVLQQPNVIQSGGVSHGGSIGAARQLRQFLFVFQRKNDSETKLLSIPAVSQSIAYVQKIIGNQTTSNILMLFLSMRAFCSP